MLNYRKINWNKILGYPLLLLCILWIALGYYQKNQLEKKYKLTIGQIRHVNGTSYKNNSRGIEYEFIVNGVKYSSSTGFSNCDIYKLTDLSWLLVNRNFKIAYDSADPSINTIIIREKDAVTFNQKITDTILHFDSIYNCLRVYSNF